MVALIIISSFSDHGLSSMLRFNRKKVEAPKPVPVAEPVRDPTRSIYYDPVLNPFGAPPPGQPYLEYRKILDLVDARILEKIYYVVN